MCFSRKNVSRKFLKNFQRNFERKFEQGGDKGATVELSASKREILRVLGSILTVIWLFWKTPGNFREIPWVGPVRVWPLTFDAYKLVFRVSG